MKNIERGKICALTGHRDIPDDLDENALYDCLDELILSGYDYFLCGMARGFDLFALQRLVYLKRKHNIIIEACIPFADHGASFSEKEKVNYENLLSWCDRKTVISPTYQPSCFLARDRYMVDCSDLVLAYCVKNTGGTAYTVKYAQKKNVPVKYFGEPPKNLY